MAKGSKPRFLGQLLGFLAVVVLLLSAPPALAAKQPVDYIGGPSSGPLGGEFESAPPGVAINNSGAGNVPPGTIYATDGGSFDNSSERGNRIEVFHRNDHGTPADATDDTYEFVAAWGAGVENGGSNFEICAVASKCRKGTGEGGNGTLEGDGALNKPGGIAIDEDTGDVYVADSSSRRTPDDNFRINVYTATGEFLRSFGWDVVESGPDDNGNGFEICKAGADVCKAGSSGSGTGQIGSRPNGEFVGESIAISAPDGNPTTGSVFFADASNRRINTYQLDGSAPSSLGSSSIFGGSSPTTVAVDSRGIVYAGGHDPSETTAQIARYDSENANGEGAGFLAPITSPSDEKQELSVLATAGQFKLGLGADTTGDLPYNATSEEVREALWALPSIGEKNIQVSYFGEGRYSFTFGGSLAGTDVPQLLVSKGSVPLNGSAKVTTTSAGHGGPLSGLPTSLAVNLDPDGPGPNTDILYVGSHGGIQQFGPLDKPGATSPPTEVDEVDGDNGVIEDFPSLAVEAQTDRLYAGAYKPFNGKIEGGGVGIYVLDSTGPPPTVSLDSTSNITSHSVTAHGTVDPNGPPDSAYYFEYSRDGEHWERTAAVVVGSQETPQPVNATIEPPAGGLEPNTPYEVRLVVARKLSASVVSAPLSFMTLPERPSAETTGSPLRTATTARLEGRVDPRNSATTYRFEYGDEGPCGTSSCESTPSHAAGSSGEIELVSQLIGGLRGRYHLPLSRSG